MTGKKPQTSLDGRLAAYLAAVGGAAAASSTAQAAVVGNATVQPFGVNGEVSIDFNTDGQIDFQIDHDRYNLNGNDLDYLQIDKNDANSETDPLPFNDTATFPPGATTANDTNGAGYVISPNQIGSYPAALDAGTVIGPTSSFDWQEGTNFDNTGRWIRANRLIDEDATQIDQAVGGRAPSGVQVPLNGPNFDGLGGEVHYLGLEMELNNAGLTNYGWVGIRIDNEADATGAVVGYAYQSIPGRQILAGDLVPEPASIFMAAGGALALIGAAICRRRK
jgi:opacity protein-like surface antigen